MTRIVQLFRGRRAWRVLVGSILANVVFASPVTLAGQTQNPFLESAPSGQASPVALQLSLEDAVDRGLRYNLGLIDSTSAATDARAARLAGLSALLPTITARAAQVYENLSLKEIGLTLPGLPPTTGGFGYQDLRVAVTQSVYNRELLTRYRSDEATELAAALDARDARDIVVFAVGSAYFQIVASTARLETSRALLATSDELSRLAADRVAAEVAPEIDSIRAQVERQSADQRMINATNDLEKDKLMLARAIGLPIGQEFSVVTAAPYQPLAGMTRESLTAEALAGRSDLAGAKARTAAAELGVRAAQAQTYPSVSVSADYGGGGDHTNFNQVYTIAAAVSVPIYTGGRIRADVLRAESTLSQRRAEYESLKARVAYDVQVAWLDLTAATSSVAASQHNQQLAGHALTQAEDRYANGVTNYLEVLQSQATIAQANENLVTSLYAFNVAKLALARASGHAELSAKEWFGR